ncbi:MAG: hypothetical protein IKS05_07170 [Oscillospiraceae bacterium]|nr:hypothetical protein [Oscillospiraceae bacterium]
MASKQKKSGKPNAAAVSRQQQRQAEEKALAREAEKAAENARKTGKLSRAYLYTLLALVAVFSLYVTVRTLLFPAASLAELRDNYLFLSLVAIPYLLLTAAVVIRRLRAKKRAQASDKLRQGELGLFLVVLLSCLLLFTTQIFTGRRDASGIAPYQNTVKALREAGVSVQEPEEVPGFQSLLEYSLMSTLECDSTALTLHYHSDSLGFARRFFKQAALDYKDLPVTEQGEIRIWGPAEAEGSATAALAVCREGQSLVLELKGPMAELEKLIPILAACLGGQA